MTPNLNNTTTGASTQITEFIQIVLSPVFFIVVAGLLGFCFALYLGYKWHEAIFVGFCTTIITALFFLFLK